MAFVQSLVFRWVLECSWRLSEARLATISHLMLHAKKAYRMHLNVIENQLSIHLKDLYAFGMPMSAMRIELEANRPKPIGQKSTTEFPALDKHLHEGSSYVARHIPSHTTTPPYQTIYLELYSEKNSCQ